MGKWITNKLISASGLYSQHPRKYCRHSYTIVIRQTVEVSESDNSNGAQVLKWLFMVTAMARKITERLAAQTVYAQAGNIAGILL